MVDQYIKYWGRWCIKLILNEGSLCKRIGIIKLAILSNHFRKLVYCRSYNINILIIPNQFISLRIFSQQFWYFFCPIDLVFRTTNIFQILIGLFIIKGFFKHHLFTLFLTLTLGLFFTCFVFVALHIGKINQHFLFLFLFTLLHNMSVLLWVIAYYELIVRSFVGQLSVSFLEISLFGVFECHSFGFLFDLVVISKILFFSLIAIVSSLSFRRNSFVRFFYRYIVALDYIFLVFLQSLFTLSLTLFTLFLTVLK